MIKYSYTILYVQDVEVAMRFYTEAFGFEKKFITPEKDYGELLSGETTISFALNSLAESNLSKGFIKANGRQALGIEMGFVVEDVEAVVNTAVEVGATIYEPIQVKPWGQSVAYIRDLDGFLIELCTAVH